MKRLACLLVLALPVLLVGPRAFADQPTIQRVPIDNEFVDSSCGFDVDVHDTGTEVIISYVDEDGVYHEIDAFPQGTEVLTNLETGKIVTLNIAGPGKFTAYQDGSFTLVGTGTWSWGINPDTGEPGIHLTVGRFTFAVDADGNVTFSRTGNLVDVCSLLA